jgi:high-affinity nickel-transport protein
VTGLDPVLSTLALGFVLGLQHATDPDHLVAVGTILAGEQRFARGAMVGVLWGAGHTLTLGLAGGALMALGVTLPAAMGAGLELLVAAMLILLGALRLAQALRGLHPLPPRARLADHAHGSVEVLHSHPHPHDGEPRSHVHPSRRLLTALGGHHWRWAPRTLAVGAVHGLAGSAAVALVVVAGVRSPWAAGAYLVLFGLGTMAGMTALTAALAYPVSRLARRPRVGRAVGIVAGLASIVLGIVWGMTAHP